MLRGHRASEAILQKKVFWVLVSKAFQTSSLYSGRESWKALAQSENLVQFLSEVVQMKLPRNLDQLTAAGWVIHLPYPWLDPFAYLIIRAFPGLVEITIICELVGSEVIRFSPVFLITCKSGKIIPSFRVRQRGLIKHERERGDGRSQIWESSPIFSIRDLTSARRRVTICEFLKGFCLYLAGLLHISIPWAQAVEKLFKDSVLANFSTCKHAITIIFLRVEVWT